MVSTQIKQVIQQGSDSIRQIQQRTDEVNVGGTERWFSLIVGCGLVSFGTEHAINQSKLSLLDVLSALVGAELIYRGISRHSFAYQVLKVNKAEQEPVIEHVEKVMTINRSLADFDPFRYTRVQQENDQASTGEHREVLDAWQALQEVTSTHHGQITFSEAPRGRGTEVRVTFDFMPLAGKVGSTVLKLSGKSPKHQVSAAMRHFKSIMETGEIVTTEGQPQGA